LFVKLFSLLFKTLFVCLLSSFFLPFFLPLVKRTIILVIFFQILQGFTLVPWQKVGRIWLGFAGILLKLTLFVCLLSCFPYFLNFPLFVCLLSLVLLLISSKFSFLLSLYSNDMAPKSRNLKIFSAFFPPFWKKKSLSLSIFELAQKSLQIWDPLLIRVQTSTSKPA